MRRDLAHNMNGEPSKGTALQATADAVVDLLNLEAEIIRDGSDEPLSKKRRLLNNKIKVVLVGIFVAFWACCLASGHVRAPLADATGDDSERFVQWAQMFQVIIYSTLYLMHIHVICERYIASHANTYCRQN